jgi:hypothetical protein
MLKTAAQEAHLKTSGAAVAVWASSFGTRSGVAHCGQRAL